VSFDAAFTKVLCFLNFLHLLFGWLKLTVWQDSSLKCRVGRKTLLTYLLVYLKEYEMSAAERRKLNDLIKNNGGGGSSVLWGAVAMMVAGGALILISLVIGLVACLIDRHSKVVWFAVVFF